AGRWVEAGDLQAGMWLRTSAGTWVQITATDHTRRPQRVHNLTVDGVHTYYALAGQTQLLVNNCGDPVEVTIKRESGMPKAEFE
ncbi:polymorphic toxin-type HINT domain-containing protein, partial [Streptomyces sp. URMC 126]|uniref:polymorphic toxin-type HINT domain-containing protein n=1 Tax=Streptomyces sp. URMC 126 TaxID=3423401 RepID=UPI003F1D8011